MSARRRDILPLLFGLLFAALTLAPTGAASQPLRPQDSGIDGNTPGIHLFVSSRYLDGICRDRLLFARMRYYNSQYQEALYVGDYEHALIYTDSMILIAKRHPIHGIGFPKYYEHRADLLRLMGHKREACEAYDLAVTQQDIQMHKEQNEEISEMQTLYELDRLALGKALLADHRHRQLSVWLLLLCSVGGGVIGFAYLGNRRTKRLQQELLLKIQHARESEQKKTDFINSMCHEVRTPLNCISGFAELLCNDDTQQETFTQYCEIIQDNRRQLRYLFDDLLEVAYLETLADRLPCRQVNLGTLCRAQLRTLKIRYRKAGVSYIDATTVEPITITTNEKYLTLMLSAILNNAYKFTQQGEIRIECGLMGKEQVYIAISDTGCGIPEEHHAHVFERFTKLDTFSPGNGLGLYLCRLIARHLGSTICIDPSYTQGTRIEITLPLCGPLRCVAEEQGQAEKITKTKKSL